MEKKTSTKFLVLLLSFSFLGIIAGADDSIATECSSKFQKVMQCLPFATAKMAAPSKDCCDSAENLKDSNPACLCFIIQQIHNGSNPTAKSMGLQESRLLQLPSACKLVNASVTECPKLLHLPPNSPDALIFTNTSGAANAATSTPSASSSTTPSTGDWVKPQLSGSVIVAMAVVFHVGLMY